MEISNNVIWMLFLFYIGFVVWVYSLLKKQLGRVFPLVYKTYRPTLSVALETYRWKTGFISTAQHYNFALRGLLRVEIFREGLLASALGKAVWLPYTQHTFTATSSSYMSKLAIDGIPVSPTPLIGPFNFFRPTTTLTLFLSPRVCQEIVRLREEAVLRERNQPAT